MSRFVSGIANLVGEEYRTTMLRDDLTLARLMVYVQSIEESKLRRTDRSLKRSGASDKEITRLKKKVESQGESRSAKLKVEKGGRSKDRKPTCAKFGKKHYGECLLGTGSCFGCDDAPTKRHFYALRSTLEKLDEKESDDDVGPKTGGMEVPSRPQTMEQLTASHGYDARSKGVADGVLKMGGKGSLVTHCSQRRRDMTPHRGCDGPSRAVVHHLFCAGATAKLWVNW
ncbi:hypothetical protein EJD97_012806 [Solanum chilense]|uniref:Uncharacterized protein n=1 Tax=Solanum chilense TaxID=4083 RepID=A0A6N2BCD9_SOLCI|nr:hypothetical protein EJD97_012806 [Solanum chilense]